MVILFQMVYVKDRAVDSERALTHFFVDWLPTVRWGVCWAWNHAILDLVMYPDALNPHSFSFSLLLLLCHHCIKIVIFPQVECPQIAGLSVLSAIAHVISPHEGRAGASV
jgi:hypothetical protein